jgi:thiamine biosynthesis lipoprotein
MAGRSNGAFDVTAGALTRVWRRARRLGELPSDADLEAARASSGHRLMRLGVDDQALWLARAGVRIDLGGIGKGYAADRALDALRAAGVEQAMVAAGGDIAVGAAPPGADGWHVALAPFGPGEPAPAGALVLAGAGISTSGDAEQWVDIGGVRYSHILDPRTGQPLTGERVVTVVARDATTSDMLATTASVLGPTAGAALVAETPGASALIGVRGEGGRIQWTRGGDPTYFIR